MEKEYLNSLLERQIERNTAINDISTKSDYIEWLYNFTVKHNNFFDDEWEYSEVKLNDNDLENVYHLGYFFELLYNYARKHKIDSTPEIFGECLFIKYKDVFFKVGYMSGQGTSFYCDRLDRIEEKADVINYMDIIKENNVKIDCTEDKLMIDFEKIVTTLFDLEYDKNTIINKIEDIYAKKLSRKK